MLPAARWRERAVPTAVWREGGTPGLASAVGVEVGPSPREEACAPTGIVVLDLAPFDVWPVVAAHGVPPFDAPPSRFALSGATRIHPSRSSAGVSGRSAVCVAARMASVRQVAGVSR